MSENHELNPSPEEIEETPSLESSENQFEPSEKKMVSISEEELQSLKKEVEDSKDRYLRLLAEQENMRKRLVKEREQMTQHAIQNVILEFLNPIDHLEGALSYTENMSPEMKNWAEGFKMILNQFKDVLGNEGVEPFSSMGKHFDPHHHDAIEVIETDEHPPGTVIKESSKGYKMHNRTIRHARVSVSKASTKNEIKE